MKYILLFLALMLFSSGASAQIKTESVEYRDGETVLEGYLAYDSTLTGTRPGVLVIHEWTGLNDYVKMRAGQLAKLGYVAFAADIYGKGVRPSNPTEARQQAMIYYGDRSLFQRRLNAGLAELRKNALVDQRHIAAIGYCFGGSGVLELARSGADIAGVISFHGGLDNPTPENARNIKCKVLVLTGAEDPNVPPEKRAAFAKEMSDAKVDWQMCTYGGAVHGFTNPANGNDPSKGVAYNAQADRRSWEEMKLFFAEIFKQ